MLKQKIFKKTLLKMLEKNMIHQTRLPMDINKKVIGMMKDEL